MSNIPLTNSKYSGYNWQQETFLIADDDIYSNLLLEKMLLKTGAKVYCASNGIQAIDLLKEHVDISVAILDLLMPGMTGYQVVEMGQKLRSDVVFVACTADVLRLNKERCEDLGFYAYIHKPFLPVRLLTVIAEALEVREQLLSS